jgi:ATP-dependent RNA helicase DDX5/DBP2
MASPALSVDEYRRLHSINISVIGESASAEAPADSGAQPGCSATGGDDDGDGAGVNAGSDLDGTGAAERWPPVQAFADAPFHARLLQEMRHAAFRAPTPIQAQCWPIANDGRDVVAIAKTGSGKTLGYLLPIFHRALTRAEQMAASKAARSPFAIVLAPTRELVLQIHEQAAQFGHSARS